MGKLTQEQADAKIALWTETKTGKIEEKRKRISTETQKEKNARMAAEEEKKLAIAEKVKIKNTPPPVEEVPEATAETTGAPADETPAAAEGAAEAPPAEQLEETICYLLIIIRYSN